MSRKVRATYSPFAAGQMREMLIAYFENHPEILDRPTNYPEGRDQLVNIPLIFGTSRLFKPDNPETCSVF